MKKGKGKGVKGAVKKMASKVKKGIKKLVK